MNKIKDPFSDPLLNRQHLKVIVEGGAGSGKTHMGLTFPNVCVIDPEHGTDFFLGRAFTTKDGSEKEFQFKANYTRSIYEAIDIIEMLSKDQFGYETLMIDPITLFWESAQDTHQMNLENKIRSGRTARQEADIQFGDWKDIKRPYKRLMSRLLDLPMHVVIIGRLSDDYKVHPGGRVEKVGESIDAEKSTDYNVDFIVRLGRQGSKRLGMFRKDRSQLFEGKTVENVSFETFLPALERIERAKNKYNVGGNVSTPDEAAEKGVEILQEKEKEAKKKSLTARVESAKGAFVSIGKEENYEQIIKDLGDLNDMTIEQLTSALESIKGQYSLLKAQEEK